MAVLENLQSKYQEFKGLETNVENLNSMLDFYESCIPAFFFKGENGEADNIKKIYKVVNESEDIQSKKILSIDINECGHIYMEYVDGMVQFINDIKNSTPNDTVNLETFQEKFDIAKSNDSLFIESLFNGDINKFTEMPVSEALVNVEYLIDFIPQIKSLKSRCDTMQESVSDELPGFKNDLLSYTMNMLFESVNNYCYNTLKTVFETYNDIYEAVIASESNPTSSEGAYQLF